MRFANPQWMWVSVGLALALGLFLVWAWHVRKRLVSRFVPPRLLALLTVGVSPQRQKLRLWLVFLAAVLLSVSLARPQWGFGYKEVKQKGLDIIVAIDTSKSMLAEDLAPNRLTKAKLAVLDLRRISHADRIGLIAFAGAAFLQMPMSTDEDVLRQNLDALDTNLLPQGGTAITEAIETANTAFKDSGQENHRALILLTDGEDHDGAAIEAAKKAAAAGTVVFTVGVGTTAGELIPVRDAKGRISYVKDEAGNTVKTRLNEALLREVAKAGNGFYLQLAGAGVMETLYERGLAPLPKREFETSLSKLFFERFQWFLGASLLLLMAEMLVSDRRRRASQAAPVAAAAVAALMLLSPAAAQASASSARKSYDQGQYKNALNEYERLLEKKPDNSPLHYNAGSAAFQAGRFESAADHFSAALATGDLSLQQKAYYNRGNSQFRQGEEAEDPSKKMELWKKSLNDFETTLKLDPKDADARQNAEMVSRKIEELKQQQQKQDQNQGSDKDNKENKDDKKESKDKNDSKDGSNKENKDSQQNQEKQQQQDGDKKENQDGSKEGDQDKKDQKQKGEDSKQKDEQKQNAQQQQNKDGEGKDSKDPKDSSAAQAPDPKDERDKKGGKAAEQKEGANPPGENDQEPQQGTPGKVMQMTRRDAIRLLEALRADERLLRPTPPTKTNRTQRAFKDW